MTTNTAHDITARVSMYAFTLDEDSDPIVDVVTTDAIATLTEAFVQPVTLSPLFHDDYTEDDVYAVLDRFGIRVGSAYVNAAA